MVDCRQGDTDRDEASFLDYIPNHRVDVLILTHAHYDHFSGIQNLLDNDIDVVEVWESNYERRRGDPSVEYNEWQEYRDLVAKLGAAVYHPTRSTKRFDTVGGAAFQFWFSSELVTGETSR